MKLLIAFALFAAASAQTAVEDSEPALAFSKEFAYNLDLQNNLNLGDKFSGIDYQAAFDNFFNVTGVAETPLGSITAFIGDLAYPAIVFLTSAFAIYLVAQIVYQVEISRTMQS